MKFDKNETLLSIVIPVYNVEKYLDQCVNSIMSQNCDEFEVILVDDGSPDGSPKICDYYADMYNNITVIHKKNGGLVSARKAGASASKGRYVTFVDSDDWVEKGYILSIISIIKKTSSQIISINGLYRVESNGRIIRCKDSNRNGLYNRTKLETDVFSEILYKKPFYSFGVKPAICLKVIERDFLIQFLNGVPDCITMGEDLCVSLPALLSANSVYFSDICGYYYRMNPTSITHSYDPKSTVRITKLLDYLEEVIAPYECKFDIKYQMNMYSVFIVSEALVSLILRSCDMKKNLGEMEGLIQRCILVCDGKKEIPLKIRLLLKLAKRKQLYLLKLLKKGFMLKLELSNNR